MSDADKADSVNQAALSADTVVPFQARKAMQEAIFEMLKMENEWTTWSDSVALAEAAAQALENGGFVIAKWVGQVLREVAPDEQS